MKILYIAPERHSAALAATVLHRVARDVALTWAATAPSALRWLAGNADAAVVVVEVHAQSGASLIEQLRTLHPTTPVVVVVGSGDLGQPVAALNAGASGYVLAGGTLQTELPRIVGLVIDREGRRRELLTHALREVEARRDRAEERLALAEQARQRTEQCSASELAAAAARLADIQSRHTASLSREARICTALQQKAFELETALRQADERRASEAAAFADRLAKRHAEFTASLTQAAQSRDALAAQLSVATAALDEAQQARRDEASAADALRGREAELAAALGEAVAARATLEARLAEAEAADREARERAEIDLAGANERQAALEDLLTQESDRRTSLEQRLAAAESAREEADRRHAAEQTIAAARIADIQARHDAALADNAAARDEFERRAAEAASALERLIQERASDAAAAADELARREAELAAELVLATAATTAAECALADAQSAHRQAAERAAADLASARDRAAEAEAQATAREADFVERLTAESSARAALEGDLAAVRTKSARMRRRSMRIVSAYRRRVRDEKAALETQLTAELHEAKRELSAKREEIRQVQLEHETLRHLLATTQDQLRDLQGTIADERQAYERTRLASETDLQRLSGEHGQLRQSFDALQGAFQTLEGVAGEHAAERGRLERVVGDRDAELRAQAERHRIADEAAQDALAALEQTLRQAAEASGSAIARLQGEVDAFRRELDTGRLRAEALRHVADRVPDLQAQLELSRKEARRQFEQAPYALCRCTDDGVIMDANHSFLTLLGRRRLDEVRNTAFATAVVDCAGDLGWLLERARRIRRTEPVESHWKTRDGRRLIVRLQAFATTRGFLEIVVEDITAIHALEERLRHSHRMESVGRLASEVAVTCEASLREIARGAHDWLTAIGGDDVLRREGDLLLGEVARAESVLRQLAIYGHEQARALEPVSVPRALRTLAPVLNRLIGDEIELVLPKPSGSLTVEVDAERLERIFVNVACYARERMPSGGQIRIDLATTTLGRRVVTRHPHVRAGAHVLITVTELPRAESLGESLRSSRSADNVGIDLSALIELVGACKGYLWVEAHPAGYTVLKIHLPRPAASDGSDIREADAHSDRGGRLARLFRRSGAAARA